MNRTLKNFLAALSLIVVAGCASSSGTKLQTKSESGDVVTTYDDPTYGIRLTYPGDWQEQSIPFMMRPKGTIIVLAAPANVEGMKMPPTLSVVARDLAGNEQLDALEQQLIERAKSQISDFKLIGTAQTTVAGEPARQVIYTGSKLGVSMQVMNVIALHAGKQFGFAYSADPQMYDDHLAAVQRVIGSVRWAPAAKSK